MVEHRDAGVRVFPEDKEVLIGRSCLGLISSLCVSSTQLQARHCAYRVAENEASVIEKFLEFHGGVGVLVRGQVRLAAYISGIETSEERNEIDSRYNQLIGNGELQQFDSLSRIIVFQCAKRAKRWHVTELD